MKGCLLLEGMGCQKGQLDLSLSRSSNLVGMAKKPEQVNTFIKTVLLADFILTMVCGLD